MPSLLRLPRDLAQLLCEQCHHRLDQHWWEEPKFFCTAGWIIYGPNRRDGCHCPEFEGLTWLDLMQKLDSEEAYMEAQELTATDRPHFWMGTKDYMGCPSEVWKLVEQWNKQAGFKNAVDVMKAPLLVAIYKAGQESVKEEG